MHDECASGEWQTTKLGLSQHTFVTMVRSRSRCCNGTRKGSDVLSPQVGTNRVYKRYARSPDPGKLPAWFRRLRDLEKKEARELSNEDFDEDLSEMSEGELTAWEQKQDETCYCVCHTSCNKCEEGKCDCSCTCSSDCASNTNARAASEDEDTQQFRKLKKWRDRLKIEYAQKRREEEVEQASSIRQSADREQEVAVAYRILSAIERQLRRTGGKMDKISWPSPKSRHKRRTYTLFSTTHQRYCYRKDAAAMYVEFESVPEEDASLSPAFSNGHTNGDINGQTHKSDGGAMSGSIWGCKFRPFKPPKRANTSGVIVETRQGRYKLRIRFLGDGYIKVKVPREVVLLQDGQSTAPEVVKDYPSTFHYVGIDNEKLQAEQKMMQEETIQRQLSSPPTQYSEPDKLPFHGYG